MSTFQPMGETMTIDTFMDIVTNSISILSCKQNFCLLSWLSCKRELNSIFPSPVKSRANLISFCFVWFSCKSELNSTFPSLVKSRANLISFYVVWLSCKPELNSIFPTFVNSRANLISFYFVLLSCTPGRRISF